MAILNFIKGLLRKEEELSEKSAQRLKGLPPEDRDNEMVSFLYRCCFDNAVKFVHEEMRRSGSPFVNLSRDHFFREILLMNFWMVDKVFRKHRPELAGKLHQHYFGLLPEGAGSAGDLAKRFKGYYSFWDDYSGHQDLFGAKAGEFIFGLKSENGGSDNPGCGYSEREVSFWIISYADEAIKSLKKIRKAYRQAEIF